MWLPSLNIKFEKFMHNVVVAIAHSLSLLYCLPLNEYTSYLSITLLMDIWVVPSLGFL